MKWDGQLFAQIQKIAWITVAWTIFSLFQFIIGYGTILDLNLTDVLDPMTPFRTSILTGILAGILGGGGMVFFWEKWLRTKPYGWTLRHILFTYMIIFVLVAYPSNTYYLSQELDLSPFNKEVLKIALDRLTYSTTLIPFTVWLVVVVFTIIALLVNDKYGPGVFRKFLMGHYFNPHREERIFMFLDLRSSTTIAEKLGEERYFSFLRKVFEFATPPILQYKGEIYQYVGDEIVISWELDKGVKDANCLQCFFSIQEAINKRKQFFLDEYEHQPEFKAGLHYGYVMAGEIGVVKREIAFSGDVLNTAARIQAKCNEFGVNLLASKAMIDALKLDGSLHPKEIGNIELRGKKELVTLFTI